MSRMFEEGGWSMWVVLLGAVVAFVFVVLAAGASVAASRDLAIRSSTLALIASLAPPALGVLAYVLVMWNGGRDVYNPDPVSQATIHAVASREAMNNVVFGGTTGTALCLISIALCVRALWLPHRAEVGHRG